jgi:hypothetical protein
METFGGDDGGGEAMYGGVSGQFYELFLMPLRCCE